MMASVFSVAFDYLHSLITDVPVLTRKFEMLNSQMVSVVEHVLPEKSIQLVTNTSSVIVGGKSFSNRPPGIAVTEIRKVGTGQKLFFNFQQNMR